MRFLPTEDAALFQKTLHDFLVRACPPERVRALWESETGRSPELWKELAAVGALGAQIPEAHGGLGLDATDTLGLFEEMGRAALPEPVDAAAVGAALLAESGDGARAARWLPRVAAGEARLAVGHPVSPFVADAHVADLLLLPSGGEVHAVPGEAVECVAEPANDPGRRIFTVRWEPGPATLLAAGPEAEALLAAALDRGALFAAAQAVGVADRLLELAVRHATERHQFGRPIGAFQAVKHLLADVKVRLEYARPVVQRAAWSMARGLSTRARDVSHAKAAACEAATLAAGTALQIHGAIGYTWEHDLHLWMRRAWSLARAWGDPAFHRGRVRDAILAGDAALAPGTTFVSPNPS